MTWLPVAGHQSTDSNSKLDSQFSCLIHKCMENSRCQSTNCQFFLAGNRQERPNHPNQSKGTNNLTSPTPNVGQGAHGSWQNQPEPPGYIHNLCDPPLCCGECRDCPPQDCPQMYSTIFSPRLLDWGRWQKRRGYNFLSSKHNLCDPSPLVASPVHQCSFNSNDKLQ